MASDQKHISNRIPERWFVRLGVGTFYSLFSLIPLLFPTAPLTASEPDWQIYGRLLRRYTSPGIKGGVTLVLIDYRGLGADGRWPAVIDRLQRFNPGRLKNRSERMAFYINAYNILTVQTILEHNRVRSIREIRNVWNRPAGRVGGVSVSLDGLEKGVLARFKEPRIHFALVCAAVSCPDLRGEPYRARRLEWQLDNQTGRFLKNPGKGLRFNHVGRRYFLSELFRWYHGDFKQAGGTERFITRHYGVLPPDYRLAGYLKYSWILNGK